MSAGAGVVQSVQAAQSLSPLSPEHLTRSGDLSPRISQGPTHKFPRLLKSWSTLCSGSLLFLGIPGS